MNFNVSIGIGLVFIFLFFLVGKKGYFGCFEFGVVVLECLKCEVKFLVIVFEIIESVWFSCERKMYIVFKECGN